MPHVVHPWACLTPSSLYLPLSHPYLPPVIASLFSVSVSLIFFLIIFICIFKTAHVSEIIRYLPFSVWLISLRVAPSTPIHIHPANFAQMANFFFFYVWVVFSSPIF